MWLVWMGQKFGGGQKGFKICVRRRKRALGNHICSVARAFPYFMLQCDEPDIFKLLSELCNNTQMALDLSQHSVPVLYLCFSSSLQQQYRLLIRCSSTRLRKLSLCLHMALSVIIFKGQNWKIWRFPPKNAQFLRCLKAVRASKVLNLQKQSQCQRHISVCVMRTSIFNTL